MNSIVKNKYFKSVVSKGFILSFSALLVSFFLFSCKKDINYDIKLATALSATASKSEVLLQQKQSSNDAVTINWTSGTNNGTGASISYILQVDKKGNSFKSPMVYNMGKGVYSKGLNVAALNDSLISRWKVAPGTVSALEARVISTVYSTPQTSETSNTVEIKLTPYQPVSPTLFIVGSATPIGWNIGNAIALKPDAASPWIFTYQGQMSTGTFKFAVNQNGCWCQDFYTKDATNSGKLIHNIGGSGDDLQWQITKGGQYKIVVDLIDMTIAIEAFSSPVFDKLWIVGDASPSGWDINTPKPFVQSASNPFIFTYEADLKAGEFKILAGKTGDWCGEWYRPLVPAQDLALSDVAQNSGCDVDNKWKITAADQGRYKITLNTYTNKIKIEKVMLYIIGDATPNGWNIGSPTPMTIENGVYVYTGPLKAGEFKFSKYKGDWCDDDWIIAATANQSISNTAFTIRHGCEGDDNKWKVLDGEVGNYVIKIDLNLNTLNIAKQ